MQCDEFDCEASTSSSSGQSSSSKIKPVLELNELDTALNELGMLSSLTESRRDYLHEKSKRPVLNLVEMNTRFVSSVSIGLRMKSVTGVPLRVKPYFIPTRSRGEERHRTRSENADGLELEVPSLLGPHTTTLFTIPTLTTPAVPDDETLSVHQQIKKSKSLENVHLEDVQTPVPELEFVSTCIQKLKMVDVE